MKRPLNVASWLRRLRDEEGSILVMTVMMMPVVLGFVGLMLDGTLILAARRELQDAADSAALAGAMQVDLEYFASTGVWRIADTGNVQGARTAHAAAQEVCEAYGVTCTTNVPSEEGQRTFHVVAETEVKTVFIHLLTGQSTLDLDSEATALMAPGF